MTKILFIECGGTIDKCYPRMTKGYNFEFGEFSASQNILNQEFDGIISFQPIFISVCKKDSLDMTDHDRDKIVNAIKTNSIKYNTNLVVVTHGTDTQIQTAKYISNKLNPDHDNKFCIAITGAVKPAKFIGSDAKFNLGSAVATVQLLDRFKNYGVFLTMNGKVFPCHNVKRDDKTGFFTASKL